MVEGEAEHALAGETPNVSNDGLTIATFAGGCFWGLEVRSLFLSCDGAWGATSVSLRGEVRSVRLTRRAAQRVFLWGLEVRSFRLVRWVVWRSECFSWGSRCVRAVRVTATCVWHSVRISTRTDEDVQVTAGARYTLPRVARSIADRIADRTAELAYQREAGVVAT